jgi:hypothetical protein
MLSGSFWTASLLIYDDAQRVVVVVVVVVVVEMVNYCLCNSYVSLYCRPETGNAAR